MKLGVLYANVGHFAEPEHFRRLVECAEQAGVDSIWNVEHVAVPLDRESRYPYTPDGEIPLPAETPITDPLISLAYAAAASERILLATGILLIAQRHPLYVAKALATLDRLSGGRAVLGVGIGWLAEEYRALGIPFGERVARTEEAVAAVRALWRPEPTSFEGRFYRFPRVYSSPKPCRPEGIPIVFGGCVEASARRAARLGDGFFPVTGDPQHLTHLVQALHDECGKLGRDPAEIEVSTSPVSLEPEVLRVYRDLGVHRLVIGSPGWPEEGLQRELERAVRAVNALE